MRNLSCVLAEIVRKGAAGEIPFCHPSRMPGVRAILRLARKKSPPCQRFRGYRSFYRGVPVRCGRYNPAATVHALPSQFGTDSMPFSRYLNRFAEGRHAAVKQSGVNQVVPRGGQIREIIIRRGRTGALLEHINRHGLLVLHHCAHAIRIPNPASASVTDNEAIPNAMAGGNTSVGERAAQHPLEQGRRTPWPVFGAVSVVGDMQIPGQEANLCRSCQVGNILGRWNRG